MQRLFIPITLILLTLAVALYLPRGFSFNPPAPPVAPQPGVPETQGKRIEVVFALDTTGSMGGLIQAAKDKIWSIASTMAAADPAPEIAIGLVAYRDRGDDYVTRVFDLTTDLDAIYAQLIAFQADGGGDGPESVNKALDDALHAISWTERADTYRTLFLVGDAPAHMDYQGERRYPELARIAAARGIVINTIRCGAQADTGAQWQQIAQATQGHFFTVTQNGGAVAIATPFDARMAELSAQLDETRLGYGSKADKAAAQARREATAALQAKAPVAALARRGAFNTSAAGKANLFGSKDLIEDIERGAITLSAVPVEALPDALAELEPEARPAAIRARKARRDALRDQLKALSEERDAFLTKEAEAAPALAESLDYQIFEAVKEQGSERGLSYSERAPKL
ncbi:MAG: vWA domain-containing protein [Pseudomonadota bacterium]